MRRRTVALAAAAPMLLLLAGCQSGPADIADGQYRAYATSGTTDPQASLVVNGDQLVVTTATGDETVTIGDPGDSYTLCPPDGSGRPRLLRGVMTIGDVVLQQPAIFGDCETTAPSRLTIVDLASFDASLGPFSFGEWVEFCDTRDPSCS
ncbi:MAG: hypothetical protein GC156_00885 [Actinomycetales bacterium]|nr:hypothetical protein [Actinomycetales bacterium]